MSFSHRFVLEGVHQDNVGILPGHTPNAYLTTELLGGFGAWWFINVIVLFCPSIHLPRLGAPKSLAKLAVKCC